MASLRYSFRLPNPAQAMHMKKLGWVTDNWELAGTTRIMSGAPFLPGYQLVTGTDITGTTSEGARVNVLDPNAPPLERFGPPERGTFGNAGRNILEGPGYQNVNVALLKRVPLAGRTSLQLRAEAFNLLNRVNFDLPDNFYGSPTFGQILSAAPPRHVQFGARLSF